MRFPFSSFQLQKTSNRLRSSTHIELYPSTYAKIKCPIGRIWQDILWINSLLESDRFPASRTGYRMGRHAKTIAYSSSFLTFFNATSAINRVNCCIDVICFRRSPPPAQTESWWPLILELSSPEGYQDNSLVALSLLSARPSCESYMNSYINNADISPRHSNQTKKFLKR